MAKQITLPDISKIEHVYNLLTSPEKYAQMLADLKEVITTAKEKLGDLDAKDAAIEYLSRAEEKYNSAQAYAAKVSKEVGSKLNDVKTAEAALKAAQEAFEHTKSHAESVIQMQESKLLGEQKSFAEFVKSKEADLASAKAALDSRQSYLTKAEAEVAEQKAKFKKALE